MQQQQKPKVYLYKAHGSMFAVIRECITAAKDAGWTEKDIALWCEEAVKGDFNHLMEHVKEGFDVILD